MEDGSEPKFLHDSYLEWCGNQPVPGRPVPQLSSNGT